MLRRCRMMRRDWTRATMPVPTIMPCGRRLVDIAARDDGGEPGIVATERPNNLLHQQADAEHCQRPDAADECDAERSITAGAISRSCRRCRRPHRRRAPLLFLTPRRRTNCLGCRSPWRPGAGCREHLAVSTCDTADSHRAPASRGTRRRTKPARDRDGQSTNGRPIGSISALPAPNVAAEIALCARFCIWIERYRAKTASGMRASAMPDSAPISDVLAVIPSVTMSCTPMIAPTTQSGAISIRRRVRGSAGMGSRSRSRGLCRSVDCQIAHTIPPIFSPSLRRGGKVL